MNESFEDRVKNLFGSKLFETVPNNSFPTTSWSVADGEVERQEWNREKGLSSREDEELPCSTSFYDNKGCLFKKKSRRDKAREFEGYLGEDDDDDDDEERESEEEREDDGDEEREIRDCVGMDPTLDNEDEEDEFDKAAFCKENNDERVYMSDINNHGSYINFHAVVPDSIEEPINESHQFSKDPRADHFAASTRLKEDKTVSPKTNNPDSNPKPILKRKEPQADHKPKKKVRFDPSFNDKEDSDSMLKNEDPKVPDYIRNPSKYTKYEFDLTEANDEEVNKRAFEDFCNLARKPEVEEVPVELPKSVVFTPRKKNADVVSMDESVGNSNEILGCSVALESDSCEMEEDDAEANVNVNVSKKRGRQYRSSLKSMLEDGL